MTHNTDIDSIFTFESIILKLIKIGSNWNKHTCSGRVGILTVLKNESISSKLNIFGL